MKNRFLLFLSFLPLLVFSQVTIKGTVYKSDEPLESVAVYLNNTMLGTTTNADGEFSLPVKEGHYELIISYLGFKKINYALNTSTYTKPLVFTLEEDEKVLDEIIIKKIVYNDVWKRNLASFKKEFIGFTELSKDCKILNPEVLFFDYDAKKDFFETFARKPLKIKHKSLGYLITYELVSFTIKQNYVSVSGYSRYKNLKGSKRKKRKWKANRLKAYNGSRVHFLKSILNNKIEEEGFIIRQFKRVHNSEIPTEDEIKKAREVIRLSNSSINFSKKINAPKNKIDSALVTIKKLKLPKYRDYLYKSKVSTSDIISKKNNSYFFDFKDNLKVIYTKEKEEKGYILKSPFSKMRKALPQTSSVMPLEIPLEIDKLGVLVSPLSVIYDGYWSYEKFGDALPLDYIPEK